jgi:hypothetical protein
MSREINPFWKAGGKESNASFFFFFFLFIITEERRKTRKCGEGKREKAAPFHSSLLLNDGFLPIFFIFYFVVVPSNCERSLRLSNEDENSSSIKIKKKKKRSH